MSDTKYITTCCPEGLIFYGLNHCPADENGKKKIIAWKTIQQTRIWIGKGFLEDWFFIRRAERQHHKRIQLLNSRG